MTLKDDEPLFISEFSSKDTKKYVRQLVLDECTPENQRKLFDTKILIVGMGGLGIPVALYLVGSGCKNIGIVDGDKIELSNLHRQIAFNEEDIGKYKAETLGKKLQKMNSNLNLKIYSDFLTEKNVQIVSEYDLIVDCSDNIATRYLINDHSRKKIFVCASVLRWNGEIYTFSPDQACYRCLYPVMKSNPDSCNNSGIIGGVCGIIGTILAVEIIKIIFSNPVNKMIVYNAKNNKLENMKIRNRKEDCSACNDIVPKKNLNFDLKQHKEVDDEYKITWEEYFKKKNNYDLIDIRNPKLYKLAHIKDSRNIPMGTFSIDQLEKKTPVLLCSMGITAQTVAKILLDNKKDCRVLKDGLFGFKRDIDDEFPL